MTDRQARSAATPPRWRRIRASTGCSKRLAKLAAYPSRNSRPVVDHAALYRLLHREKGAPRV
jgi:hypothetical protein